MAPFRPLSPLIRTVIGSHEIDGLIIELWDHQYTVTPDTELDEPVATMATNKFGSAVVMQDGEGVGIFTTVDVCRAFADLLRTVRAS